MNQERRGGLFLDHDLGIARQEDISRTVEYDDAYFKKYIGYEGTPLAQALNDGRCGIVKKYLPNAPIVDIGIGSGEFLRAFNVLGSGLCHGYDVNQVAQGWLQAHELFLNPVGHAIPFGVTFWDSLEHMRDANLFLADIPRHRFVFVSIPIFETLDDIFKSRHYRPFEHFWYFTDAGFVKWMCSLGFFKLERQDFEIAAGREAIYTYVFRKD